MTAPAKSAFSATGTRLSIINRPQSEIKLGRNINKFFMRRFASSFAISSFSSAQSPRAKSAETRNPLFFTEQTEGDADGDAERITRCSMNARNRGITGTQARLKIVLRLVVAFIRQ